MELVSIERPEDIVKGDVIVVKYSDRAYTVLVSDIDRVDDVVPGPQAWKFTGVPVTEVTGNSLIHHDSKEFTYSENTEQPDEVLAVR